MIVILEGPERTGKTTVAHYFEEKGFIYFKDRNHIRNYKPSNIAERLDATLSFLISMDKAGVNVVLDRFHISELIYGKIRRCATRQDTEYLRYIDEILSHMNVKLVNLTREVDENFIEAYPKVISSEDLTSICGAFGYEFDKSYISKKNKFEFDISVDHLDLIYERVAERSFKYDFYLASPFFNEEQIKRENEVKNLLRANGYEVYAPMEHGVVGSLADHGTVKATFDSNVQAINESRKVIAITDGKDMGTIWEAGYAYGINKPVVYVALTLGDKPFNIMLSESGIGIYKDMTKLTQAASDDCFTNREEVHYE